ncbi:hypothetical protein [Pantoea coffeiphila]|nr:hypothetical protein [Pantoea coffeiphila]
MSIRELTIVEASQVSGAGNSNPNYYRDAGETLIALGEIAKQYALSDPQYFGMDYRVITATDPGLRQEAIRVVNILCGGKGGEKNVDSWIKLYS